MKSVYKANFKNIDYPNRNNSSKLFEKFEDAVTELTKKALKHAIENPKWETSTEGTYFSHQFSNHPQEGNSAYHGSIKKIKVY